MGRGELAHYSNGQVSEINAAIFCCCCFCFSLVFSFFVSFLFFKKNI